MFNPKILMWSEEKAKNANDKQLFMKIFELDDGNEYALSILIVDKKGERIGGGSLLSFAQNEYGTMAVKHRLISKFIPFEKNLNHELVIHSETDVEDFNERNERAQIKKMIENQIEKNLENESDQVGNQKNNKH